MASALLEKIKDSNDLPLEAVHCPTWDVTIHVRTMTGAERDEFEHTVTKSQRKNDNRGLKVQLVILTACDDKGARLFTQDDAAWLPDKSATELNRLAEAALKANGFSDADVADLEGN